MESGKWQDVNTAVGQEISRQEEQGNQTDEAGE